MAKNNIIESGLRLPEDTNQKLVTIAQKIGISKNAIVLLAIQDYLQKQDEGA
jgi:predicted transcriptional regulator